MKPEEREEGEEERTSWKGTGEETVVEGEWKARVQSTVGGEKVSNGITMHDEEMHKQRGAESAPSRETVAFSGETGVFVYNEGC